jgi:hypothetical protein
MLFSHMCISTQLIYVNIHTGKKECHFQIKTWEKGILNLNITYYITDYNSLNKL